MITVEFTSDFSPLMQSLCIAPQQVIQTVNDRHRGLLDDGFQRLLALHWFDDDLGLLVDSMVTKRTQGLHAVSIHAVRPVLTIWLRTNMPGGIVRRDAPLQDVLYIVARSFGTAVTCHSEQAPRYLYAGPWDGKLRVNGAADSRICISGSFDPERKTCELVWALDETKYLNWFTTSLAHSVRSKLSHTPESFVRAQRTLLEDLFGLSWFEAQERRRSKHPAYERWHLCGELMAERGRVRMSDDLNRVYALLGIMSDSGNLVECTRGDRHALSLGDLANYGDAAVERRFRAVIRDPREFHDALFEVACAAFHTMTGHQVVATEATGKPDLTITIPNWPLPVSAECKRQAGPVSDGWLKSVIKKANRQLKRADTEGFGVIYLDISAAVGEWNRNQNETPEAVTEIEKKVSHFLRGDYKSVSGVIVVWTEHLTLPSSKPLGTLCFVMRHSRIIRHTKPLLRLPFETQPLMIGQTMMIRMIANEARLREDQSKRRFSPTVC